MIFNTPETTNGDASSSGLVMYIPVNTSASAAPVVCLH